MAAGVTHNRITHCIHTGVVVVVVCVYIFRCQNEARVVESGSLMVI